MSGLHIFKGIKKVCGVLLFILAFYAPFMSQAQAADVVTTYKDENGWKLQVNGRDYYIKGVVWGYAPRDENFNYNLWGESDEFVRKVLDYEFGLMKAAGVNTIRSFTTIPPQWVTYIYNEYGIMTVINDLMGRYGYQVGGRWITNTDYSDELTRATLKKDMLEVVEKYKNTPGVLMFAFGNESNYGLDWSSFEIENIPEGERHAEKAKYLYSLFNEIIVAGKRIDKNHPFTIVNGETQYIDLVAEYCPDLDLFGLNSYRGKGYFDLWETVKNTLDLPVLFFESGSDAFNAKEHREDQLTQANYLKIQWLEMYNKSYGNGEEGNSIGAFVFEWRDEWWKYNVEDQEDMNKHDTHASWAAGGYTEDLVEGQNNMNEEWWGITRLGTQNADGVYEAIPRMAYDVLTEIWKIDPYLYKKAAINQSMNDLNMEYMALKSDVRTLKSERVHGYDMNESKNILSFTGGSLEGQFALKGSENDIDLNGEDGTEFTDGEMVFLDFEFQPNDKINGQFSVNLLGNVANTRPIEIEYGQRGLPITVVTNQTTNGVTVESTDVLDDRERIEIYDFDATYRGTKYDLNTFYHTPRYHWKYEGDFYGLLRETTDMDGQDIWNAKAPFGAEIVGKENLDGLKIVFGPEVYWGANPLAMLKYSNKIGDIDYTFMHSEDVARLNDSATATSATERQSRQTTLYLAKNITEKTKLEVGGIMASSEKIDDEYDRREGGNIVLDEINFEDTLGAKAQLTFDTSSAHIGNYYFTQVYLAAAYAGLVADGGDQLKEFGDEGTHLPYSGLGNKQEFETGIMMNYGDFMIYPRFLYRDNLVDANPNQQSSIVGGVLNPGLSPRNREDDPFAVLGNREARSTEIFLTYDPTGATPFYKWDNDTREDAALAFNIGANYTQYPSATDSYLFFYDEGGFNAPFGVGLPEEDVWKISSKIVVNPRSNLKIITRLLAGYQQSSGDPTGGTREFYEAEGKFIVDRKHIFSGYFKKNAWGPYDFHEQFNLTYPEQYNLEYALLLDERRNEDTSSKVGVRAFYRTLDENSPDNESQNGTNKYDFLTVFYFKWAFQ
jgi:beta-galactosidase